MIPMRSAWKRRCALVAAWCLDRLAPLFQGAAPRRPRPAHPRILLIRCDHIGDAVMATAVLRGLRTALKPERLDVLAAPWTATLFEPHPAVDRVIRYGPPWWAAARGASWPRRLRAWGALPRVVREIRRGRYDIGIDLRGDLRHIFCFLALGGIPERVSSDRTGGARLLTHVWHDDPGLHEVEKNAAIVRALDADGSPTLNPPDPGPLPDHIEAAVAHAAGPRGILALALGSSKPARRWPTHQAARLVQLAREQLALGTVFVGGPDDRPLAAEIQSQSRAPLHSLAGETSLRESLAVFRRATAVVTVDSGPMHLAAASGTPVVALFGPTDPKLYRPWSAAARVVQAPQPCACSDFECTLTRGRPGACMDSIEPERVLTALCELLA